MLDKDPIVLLPSELGQIKSPNRLEPTEIAVYLTLQLFTITAFEKRILVNNEMLYYYMFGDPDPDKRTKLTVTKAMKSLIDRKLFSCKQISKTSYIMSADSFPTPNTFALLRYTELSTILRNNGSNRYDLLRYFCCVVSSINGSTEVFHKGERKKKVVGFQKLSYFANTLDLSYRTIIRYNQILEDQKLLYIRRDSKVTTLPDGTVAQEPNIYGRYCDKAFVDSYGDFMQYTRTKQDHPSRRSLAQKYNNYIGGMKYDPETMEHIKWYAETCNPPKKMLDI